MVDQHSPIDPAQLLDRTTDIVIAYLSRNRVSIDDVEGLITKVHVALSRGYQPPTRPSPAKTVHPAVPVSKSLTPEHLICLECGKPYKTLKRHLETAHRLSAEQYREKWRLAPTYPMASPLHSRLRSAIAKQIGLGVGTRQPFIKIGA